MKNDPYTLFVALNEQVCISFSNVISMHVSRNSLVLIFYQGEAKGTLYIDDQESYEYRQGSYLLVEFIFKDNQLSSK